MLTLVFKRQYQIAGLVLACLSVCGGTDAYLELVYGSGSWEDVIKVHLPFIVLGVPAMVVLTRDRNR